VQAIDPGIQPVLVLVNFGARDLDLHQHAALSSLADCLEGTDIGDAVIGDGYTSGHRLVQCTDYCGG
jgi:hypothetical protein